MAVIVLAMCLVFDYYQIQRLRARVDTLEQQPRIIQQSTGDQPGSNIISGRDVVVDPKQ